MSQAGLYITAKDISNDSVWTRKFATSGVIARARSLNRKCQEIAAGRGVVSYTHCFQITYTNKRSRSELAYSILQVP
jgi:hypothetical protein